MRTDFPNVNALWSAAILEVLVRKGVESAVICPGSRSSPLAFAFSSHPKIAATPVLDERSAAFFALGIAKRTGKPVVLICTSGSACANFFPAVVEASESGVPILILTADRPIELRNCGAGQTIDQTKLYGEYVRRYQELPLPEATLAMIRYLRQSLSHICDASVSLDSGPVHVNVPFREPLTPELDEGFSSELTRSDLESLFEKLVRSGRHAWSESHFGDLFFETDRGLVLIGANSPVDIDSWTKNLSSFVNCLGWPVLADGLSPVRSRSNVFETLITGYEFIIRSDSLRESLIPNRVLVIGEMPTCKVLREWLSELDCETHCLVSFERNVDATHSKSTCSLFNFERNSISLANTSRSGYLNRWISLNKKVAAELDQKMENCSHLFEGKLAWTLSKYLPDRSSLCVSNSMPPRDMEFYFGGSEQELSIFSSRGANGIDGVLSTAVGVAAGSGGFNYLLIGDLALLHDTNGALIARKLQTSLTILLVNNSGGGIFQMLPVSRYGKVFKDFWVTDQNIDFADWAKTYGIEHTVVSDWNQAIKRLCERRETGIRILEFQTNSESDADTRRTFFREIVTSLESGMSHV